MQLFLTVSGLFYTSRIASIKMSFIQTDLTQSVSFSKQ